MAAGPKARAERRLRRDAASNRESLLDAATAAFVREGPKVPMATLAANAGVGVGTLYRHFPTREALFEALTERSYGILLGHVQRFDRDGEPAIEALSGYLQTVIDLRHELVLPLHGGPVTLGPGSVELRREIRRGLESILARGVAEGTIRADVAGLDLILIAARLALPLPHVPDWENASRREAEIFIAGLAPGPARPLPPPSRDSLEAIYAEDGAPGARRGRRGGANGSQR